MAVLCFGEAIVDLVCEARIEGIEEAKEFRPRFGGALANIAVAASREGAAVELAGGGGDDPWGRWLRSRLRSEGVGVRWFSLLKGLSTPVAFVTFASDGEPAFQIYGDGIEACVRSMAERLPEAIGGASALVLGSNTLVGEPERALTLEARRRAHEREIPVVFDPNLREHRWSELEVAVELSRQLCEGAFLVRANAAEAEAITGAPEPARAAEELVAAGASIAVVTSGPGGAVMRGAASAERAAVEVEVVSPLGAGDAFTGALVAVLDSAGWDAVAASDALERALEAGGRACTHWGAIA